MKEGFFSRQGSFRSLLAGVREKRRIPANGGSEEIPSSIPDLSPIANSVVHRCSRILLLPAEKLREDFEAGIDDPTQKPSGYARNLLEFCSYRALHVLIKNPDHLGDKEFRRLSYDMMLAWESPGGEGESLKVSSSGQNSEAEDEDDASFFYTSATSMAVQVDKKKTVGQDAFSRIATACPAIADPITVKHLFDALTSSSSGRLHFLIYDKYLKSLHKILKSAKNFVKLSPSSSVQLANGEIILDVDGGNPTQPVFQHVGISTWPGRLTLTSHAVYFESLGVGMYDKATKYDLAADLKQVIKRELTGPLGARLFDKAVMYKSTVIAEPVNMEFPEIKGRTRRDYWLAIILEVLNAHRYIRMFNLKEVQQGEVLSRAALGIFRYRALKEAFHIAPACFKTTLAFNLAGSLPKGNSVFEALHDHLINHSTGYQGHGNDNSSEQTSPDDLLPASLYVLVRMGFKMLKNEATFKEGKFRGCDICVGKDSPIELAVKELICYSDKVKEANATVDRVKVDGIGMNLAVMAALLFPLLELRKRIRSLLKWEDPFRSTIFLSLSVYTYYSGWIWCILPSIFLYLALRILWNKFYGKGEAMEAFHVRTPPGKNAVEQLLILQKAISELETLVQAGNIFLLKLRALLLAADPQATDTVVVHLVAVAAVLVLVPPRHLAFLAFLETFTREMPLRKETTERLTRRAKEWWIRVPAAPVRLSKPDENKNGKKKR